MPTNLSEFEDDTAFERYVLDRATPLLPRVAGTSVIELGDANSTSVAVGVQPVTVHVGLVDSTGSGGDQLSPDDIRPLLFGAAWKIIGTTVGGGSYPGWFRVAADAGRCEAQPMRSASETMIPSGPRT